MIEGEAYHEISQHTFAAALIMQWATTSADLNIQTEAAKQRVRLQILWMGVNKALKWANFQIAMGQIDWIESVVICEWNAAEERVEHKNHGNLSALKRVRLMKFNCVKDGNQ